MPRRGLAFLSRPFGRWSATPNRGREGVCG
jgi:hypothetical protein